jgi:hypothetical protein
MHWPAGEHPCSVPTGLGVFQPDGGYRGSYTQAVGRQLEGSWKAVGRQLEGSWKAVGRQLEAHCIASAMTSFVRECDGGPKCSILMVLDFRSRPIAPSRSPLFMP